MSGAERGERARLRVLFWLWAPIAFLLFSHSVDASLAGTRSGDAESGAVREARSGSGTRILTLDAETAFTLFGGDRCKEADLVPGFSSGALGTTGDLLLGESRLAFFVYDRAPGFQSGVQAFFENPQRGPPVWTPDLHQGEFVAEPKTRIGGFRLELEDLIKGEWPLSLGLCRGYEVEGWGLAEEERPDPWGLAVSPNKKGVTIASERFQHSPIEFFSWDWAAQHPDQFYSLLTDRGGMSRQAAGELMADAGVMPGGDEGRKFLVRQVVRESEQMGERAKEEWIAGMVALGVDRGLTVVGRQAAERFIERQLAKEAATAAPANGSVDDVAGGEFLNDAAGSGAMPPAPRMAFQGGVSAQQGNQISGQFREVLDIKGGNVAFAEARIDGEHQLLAAVSGSKSPLGTVPSPTKRLFKTRDSGAMSRAFDTEVKILEYLAKDLRSTSAGRVILFTERAPCKRSCVGVIKQFQEMFPNIQVEVVSGGK